MKRTYQLLAIATLVIGVSGCGSIRGLWNSGQHSACMPVCTQCGPVCAPTCNSGCNTGCNTCCEGGTGVTYGYGSPESNYIPMGTEESLPMMVP